MKNIGLVFLVLTALSLACSLGENEQEAVDSLATAVAETLAAVPPSEENSQPSEDLFNTGTVEGHVCYPGEQIPAMSLFLENINTQEVTPIPIPANQGSFSAPVPEGIYLAYAWLPDFSGGGTYSQAVPCGLNVACTDHTLIEITVISGQVTSGVEVCDWYVSPSQIPLPPGIDLSQYFGAISGNLGFPSEGIPAMTVVATNSATNQFYYVDTTQDDQTYTIPNILPGTYTVVAYPQGEDFGGGFSQFVPCGLSVACSDHSLIAVTVIAGQTTTSVDPVDFFASPDAFPENPVN